MPAFTYMILLSDHTDGTMPGDPTPQALIANNDLALGQIVDAISQSSIWPSTAIFVVEDDSQDGADHVDAHRTPAFVISPWARHGAVVSTRYDQYSMLRTAELILGHAAARPQRRAGHADVRRVHQWWAKPDNTPLLGPDSELLADTKNTSGSALASLSRRLPFYRLDAVPQAISDQILWASVHGAKSKPPTAGPNASPDEVDRAMVVEQMLRANPNIFETQTGRTARDPSHRHGHGGSLPDHMGMSARPTG